MILIDDELQNKIALQKILLNEVTVNPFCHKP